MSNATIIAVALAALAASCKGGADKSTADDKQVAQEAPAAAVEPEPEEVDALEDDEGGTGTAGAFGEGRMGKKDSRRSSGQFAMKAETMKPAPDDAPARGGKGGPGGGDEGQAATRSWFPETFLFEPLVVTDAAGAASVSVAVPDRLTSWRVLALAHIRAGAQAGAVAQFLGTLPAYVDPVAPPRLRAGDRVVLPIQMVNTGDKALATALRVSATGAQLTGGGGPVTVAPKRSAVRYATLSAARPGPIQLSASLGDTDAVVKSIAAIPAGKPLITTRSGTLAAPRTLSIDNPPLAPGASDRIRLRVFPGALAILRSELGSAMGRGGMAGDAFALLLAGDAPSLLQTLGEEPDAAALRDLSIIGTQRVVRYARTLDPASATLLARAALAHPKNPILAGIGRRAVAYLETNQLPDGTCGGADGWTLQRLLVATADCARAASSSRKVLIGAGGAFRRHAAHIRDPYTAASVLASGAPIGPELSAKLRELVRGAVVPGQSGARRVEVPAKVERADGVAPSSVEATAVAILALAGDPASKDLVADLGATVLAAYSPGFGWGDGRANLAALPALVALFGDKIDRAVSIKLAMDGAIIAQGELDPARLRDVVTLEAVDVGAGGAHEISITADPPLAGLGFSLEVTTWVPWPAMDRSRGLEIDAPPPTNLAVGRAAQWPITVAAPAGEPVVVTLEPPAGVQIDRASLDELVSAGTITRFELDDERLRLHAGPLAPSQSLAASIRVIPTLGGSLSSGPVSVEVANVSIAAPPARWEVR